MRTGDNIGMQFRNKPGFEFNGLFTLKLGRLQVNPGPFIDAQL